MMPFCANQPKEHAVIYSDLETGFGISVAVKTTTNWAKIIWWDGTEEIKEPSVGYPYETFGKIHFFKISDTNDSKRIVAYSTDSSGNKSGTIQMFTCYRQKDKRKKPGGSYHNAGKGDFYAENQKVTKMDVSTCSDLRVLKCDRNKLTSLGDVSACRLLKTIACAGNCFENIDVSRMQNLDQFYCNFNPQLSELNLPLSTTRLLGASSTALSDATLTIPYSMVHLNLRDCPNINILDLDDHSNLLYANFQNSPNLSQVYLTGCDNLHTVNVSDTPVTVLDFSGSGFTYGGVGITNFGPNDYAYGSTTRYIAMNNNSTITSTDVENIYATLPYAAYYVYSGAVIEAYNTPGAAAANDGDATNNGWTVFT